MAALGSPRLDAMFQRLLAELRLAFADMPDLRDFHEPYLRRNRGLVDLLRVGDVPAAREELTELPRGGGATDPRNAAPARSLNQVVEQSVDILLNNL